MMNIENYYSKENEKPLDCIKSDGGFCGIFRTIGCIGDSLSSGEFETVDHNNVHHFYDLFEYSWGQYLARMTGSTVYNFSRGGMTAKEYVQSFADANGFWTVKKAAQAYIIALGVNDLLGLKQELGSVEDIDPEHYENNRDSFAGWYAQIIQRVRIISPDSILFFVTMPRGESDTEEVEKKKEDHARLLTELTEVFHSSYVIDLHQYAPVYDKKFVDHFYFNGHMNAAGYLLTAKMIASYIDWIIRNHAEAFTTTGLIGTGIDPCICRKLS